MSSTKIICLAVAVALLAGTDAFAVATPKAPTPASPGCEPTSPILIRAPAPSAHLEGCGPTRSETLLGTTKSGCDPRGSACPTWVSKPFGGSGNDVPSEQGTAVAPDGKTAYTIISSGNAGMTLLAVKTKNGMQRWATSCCSSHDGYAQAIAVVASRDGHQILVTNLIQDAANPFTHCRSSIHAFKASTGTEVWSSQQRSDEICWIPTDMVAGRGGKIYVSSASRVTEDSVSARIDVFDAETGEQRTVLEEPVTQRGPTSGLSGPTGRWFPWQLVMSLDGSRLFVAEVEGDVPPGRDLEEAVGWAVSAFDISDGRFQRIWRMARSYGFSRVNPLAGITAHRNRVVVTGNFMHNRGTVEDNWETFTVALHAGTGKRAWGKRIRAAHPWPYEPIAALGRRVFVTFRTVNSDPAMESAGMIAYDSRGGQKRWRDTFRSIAKRESPDYEDWGAFPMVFTHARTRSLYQVIRGYGAIEVRSMTPRRGKPRWYSIYRRFERSGATHAATNPVDGSLVVSAYAWRSYSDTILLRYTKKR